MTFPFPTSRLDPADHYWIVGGNESQVYHSGRDAFVSATDPAYVVWLLDPQHLPSRIASNVELEDVLGQRERPFLGASIPPESIDRPRLAKARVRVVASTFTIQNATPRSVPWTAYPQSGTAARYDPMAMWGGPAPTPNPERIVIQQAGVYRFVLGVKFLETTAALPGVASVGLRAIGLFQGTGGSPTDLGTVKLPAAPLPADFTGFQVVEYTDDVPANTVLRAFVEQRCGGTLQAQARLSLIREG